MRVIYRYFFRFRRLSFSSFLYRNTLVKLFILFIFKIVYKNMNSCLKNTRVSVNTATTIYFFSVNNEVEKLLADAAILFIFDPS